MTMDERKALARSFLGKVVHIGIDRPIGYAHKKETYALAYPINYGYIPDVLGGDGEEMDVYLLGVDVPVEKFDAHIIAIVHRDDDVEDKLVVAPIGVTFDEAQIREATFFQERYFNGTVECFEEC